MTALALPLALVLPLAPGLAGPAAGGDDALLRAVAAYRYGQSREPLSRLGERVRESLADPDARREMERRLVALVDSDATVEAREFACRQLRLVGSAAAVPTLAGLLDDSRLGDAALFALASIPGEAASGALSAALEASSGRVRVGLVHALAMRGVKHPAYARLAGGEDPEAAAAATWALGRTGDVDDAARLLDVGTSGLEAREAVLRIAERSGATGEPIFRRLLGPGEPAAVRVAALRGIVRLGERDAVPDLAAALRSDAALQAEAIRLAAFGEGADVLIEATPDLEPAARRRALVSLGEAGVSRALPLMVASLTAADEGVRTAALVGVGSLGGPAHVGLLAQKAAVSTGAEREAARAALADLRGPGVDAALAATMTAAVGGAKGEAIRAAGLRDAVGATDALLAAATSPDPDIRIEALRALRRIAPAAAAAPMAGLLREPMRAAERREAERGVAAVLRRHPGVPLGPVVGVFEATTSGEVRASAVEAVGQSGRGDALPFLRRALASEEEAVQRAAVQVLTAWPTAVPAPDLLAVARGEAEGPLPVLALRGYIRLVAAPSALPPKEVVAQLAAALDAARRADERRAVLAALQQRACPESLALARTLLDDPEVAAEARLAVERLEESLSYRR